MLKIGEFSSLARVSVKTLRYYEELGLLRPVRTDPESGYRFSSAAQLPRLHRILALKDLGFPLDRIAPALESGVSADALRGMLMLRQAEQEQTLRKESDRLTRLKALLQLIEKEGMRAGEVVLKDAPPQTIASIRDRVAGPRSLGALFDRLFQSLGATAPRGVGLVLWHDREYREQDLDLEAAITVEPPLETLPPVAIRELPAAKVASIVHHGAFNRIRESHLALLYWIDANGYCPAGPMRELFLSLSTPVSRDDVSNVTEIQVPIEWVTE